MRYYCAVYEVLLCCVWGTIVLYMRYYCAVYEVLLCCIWGIIVLYIRYYCAVYEVLLCCIWGITVLYMRYYFGHSAVYEVLFRTFLWRKCRKLQQRGIQNGNCLGQYSEWAPNPKTILKFYCYASQLSFNVVTAWDHCAVLTHVDAACNVPNRLKEDQIFKKIEL